MYTYKIKLTTTNNTEVFIFLNNITSIDPWDSGCIINFEKENWISVKESPEEVFKIMKQAERIT